MLSLPEKIKEISRVRRLASQSVGTECPLAFPVIKLDALNGNSSASQTKYITQELPDLRSKNA
jgi:hypothetical protein